METANYSYIFMAHPKQPLTRICYQLIKAGTLEQAWDIFKDNHFREFLKIWNMTEEDFFIYAFTLSHRGLRDITSSLSLYRERERLMEQRTKAVKDGLNELINEY